MRVFYVIVYVLLVAALGLLEVVVARSVPVAPPEISVPVSASPR
jgi:hypothetical protein